MTKTSSKFSFKGITKVVSPSIRDLLSVKKVVTPTRSDNEVQIIEYGLPFKDIKELHPLFFSYDPRGLECVPLPHGFCPMCRCPSNYCAEIVMGEMCCDDTLAQLEFDDKTERELVTMTKDLFAKVYTEAVLSKMRWNQIEDEDRIRNTVTLIPPRCMRKNSRRRVLSVLKSYMEGKTHVHCYRKYDSESDEEDDVPNKKNCDEADSDDESVELVSRTAVEQAKDVGPMFRVVKDMINKQNK